MPVMNLDESDELSGRAVGSVTPVAQSVSARVLGPGIGPRAERSVSALRQALVEDSAVRSTARGGLARSYFADSCAEEPASLAPRSTADVGLAEWRSGPSIRTPGKSVIYTHADSGCGRTRTNSKAIGFCFVRVCWWPFPSACV